MRQTMTQTYKPIYDIVMVSDDQVNKDEDGYSSNGQGMLVFIIPGPRR